MLWDAKPTVRALRFLGHRGPVLGVAYSPRSVLIASCGHDGYARLVTPNLMRTSTTYPSPCSLQQRGEERENCFAWRVHTGAARAIAFAQDATDRLFTVGDDKSIKCWNLNYVASTHRGVGLSGGHLASPAPPEASFAAVHTGHTNWIRCLAVQQGGPCLASGGDDQCVHLWDTRTRRAVRTFFEPSASVRGLSFHPDGHLLASGDGDGALHLFELRLSRGLLQPGASGEKGERGALLQRYPAAHTGAVHDVSFAPAGDWLLSAGEDGMARVWDSREGSLYCTLQAHDGPVRASRFADDGDYFATAGKDNVVVLWRSGIPTRNSASRAPPAPHVDRIDNPSSQTDGQLQREIEQQEKVLTSHLTGEESKGKLPTPRQGILSKEQSLRKASLSRLSARPTPRKDVKAGPSEVPPKGASAGSSPPTAREAIVSGKQPPQRERSFERDEKRYSSIGSPYGVRDGDRQTEDSGKGSLDAQEKQGHAYEREGKKLVNFFTHEDETKAYQDEPTQGKRLENVEHALASLAGYFHKQQSLVYQEIDSLKRQWHTHNEKQQDDIRNLSTMMEKLIEQQNVLMKKLDTSPETIMNGN
ncbi:unnamed protein product [Phytomonas sp. Hart1]|nr:unnamed protein product [Phytomonas sp. Hart1]|eukprot:CCW67621.1 unnamed protein product [Phytomonas sp. isolate Hart1]